MYDILVFLLHCIHANINAMDPANHKLLNGFIYFNKSRLLNFFNRYFIIIFSGFNHYFQQIVFYCSHFTLYIIYLALPLLVAYLFKIKQCKQAEILLKPWYTGIHLTVRNKIFQMNTCINMAG